MVVAVLTDGITPFVTGGMQRHSFLVVNYLALSGVTVHLYTIATGRHDRQAMLNAFTEKARPNIKIFAYPFPRQDKFPGHYIRASYRFSEILAQAVLLEMESVDYHLIYAKGFTGWKLSELRRKGRLSIPLAVKFHGMNMFQRQPNLKGHITKYMLRYPVRRIMRNADYVFSYGGKITGLIAREIDDPSKIIEFPTGIESSWILGSSPKPVSDKLIFTFIGRYDRVKGLPELYAALKLLKEDNFLLNIVGPIPEDKRLKDRSIIYCGKISDEAELKRILDQSDVLLCPSISEGMPNVILEAMARGLIILATDVGATCLLVKNNGFLLESHAPALIAKGMRQLLATDASELMKLKTNSLKLIKDFTWDNLGPLLKAKMTYLLKSRTNQ